ncbi:MAG: hypothetical protein U5N85_16630 [Arcicella sp.]|nr:hypothetical protein [Arcicella sp.]
MQALSSKDYLSPVVVGFFLPDMFQRIFPFKIEEYDRARYLERCFH